MQLARPLSRPRLISLVSMVDVLLIMLVFFMVTSTYLDLDMIPVAEKSDSAASPAADHGSGAVLLVRLGSDGVTYLRGRPVGLDDLAQQVLADPDLAITILPSLRANTQALVTLMDTLTDAGAGKLRILQVAKQ